MKITEVRTRVVQWEGKTTPLPPHFCTNPMDLVMFREASMGNFAFHGWVLVEIFTDAGLVGLGNAALSPLVTKACIDNYLKPILLGSDPWDTEYLWQQMYRRTMAFGRKGVAMTAISAVDIALWDLLAMKLRFGWGPVDGAEGMQHNIELVRTVREVVGNSIDVMADAYMGWTLDYAKRMLPLLEPFNLRWLEEPVIPDDTRGYRELKAYGRVPIAGGEHEFTIFGFRDLLEANALDYIQFDTNRVGGISQARKISAMAEAYQIPVIPHAGQMHNYHVVMASLNSPMAEFFPKVDVEVGNELFWYIFDGEPVPVDGYIDLDENTPGLGLTVNEESLKRFKIIE
jgi:L-rhamnonate dehydratase